MTVFISYRYYLILLDINRCVAIDEMFERCLQKKKIIIFHIPAKVFGLDDDDDDDDGKTMTVNGIVTRETTTHTIYVSDSGEPCTYYYTFG